jgi:hypothetical protein
VDQIINGLEGHFMTAVFVSGAIALVIVAAVAYAWWRSRHWVERGRTSLATTRHTSLFTQSEDPPPIRPSGGSASGSAEEFGSRLVREAAVRAASLRDAWDRSYREARGSGPPVEGGASVSDAPTVLDDLLREQRETNALLRQLLDRLGKTEG